MMWIEIVAFSSLPGCQLFCFVLLKSSLFVFPILFYVMLCGALSCSCVVQLGGQPPRQGGQG